MKAVTHISGNYNPKMESTLSRRTQGRVMKMTVSNISRSALNDLRKMWRLD
jgi:hypothetical protein